MGALAERHERQHAPSPSLSAFITNRRYFIVTTRTSDQTIKERIPSTLSAVTDRPCDS